MKDQATRDREAAYKFLLRWGLTQSVFDKRTEILEDLTEVIAYARQNQSDEVRELELSLDELTNWLINGDMPTIIEIERGICAVKAYRANTKDSDEG